ncbi:hypothetical protein ACFE04_010598 [Oxalis oulophora]
MQLEENVKPTASRTLLVINCLLLAIGFTGGPLLMRLYFIHGGKRIWFSSWLETGGWPIFLFPLIAAYFQRRQKGPTNFFLMKPPLFIASAVVGVITGLDDYLYAYGMSLLPVSTSSLIIASQLAFTAGFAFLLVKQRFDYYTINTVFLLTFGAGILAMNADSDMPEGESTRQYVIGFIMTLGAAILYGFILPLVECIYQKCRQTMCYTLVMEFQMIMCLFATVFCTFGMFFNNDFKVIPREAREFGLGKFMYYFVAVISGIVWQGFYIGAIGVIFCSSSLLSAIIIAVLLPVTEILAVIFYKEKFEANKGVALALSLWGFISYFYGETKQMRKLKKQATESELPH